FRGVRHLFAGGEALDPRWVREAIGKGAPQGVINGYGPTESTTYAVCCRLFEVPEGAAGVPIGRPIANTTAYVVDRHGQPVPVGVAGELLLGGDGLARGYWRRPALTAERFVPDPFGPPAGKAGVRLYRTGDLARWRPDGRLDFLGRIDHQVKVRGFRVELGEIEAALMAHPAVREAVVLAPVGPGGSRRLVSYVVGGPETPEPGTLRTHLAAKLPEHMVPSAFVLLAALPLTPNGKVDRKALPDPEELSEAGSPGAAPRTPGEEILAGLWSEVLGVEQVGIFDDFFELGGHSLLATQLVSRIRRTFGREVPLAELFAAPTVAGLAAKLEAPAAAVAGNEACPPPIVPVPRTAPPPLSYSQERLWFLDQVEPGSAALNIPSPVRLHGALDRHALETSLGEVVRRHESLRTVFRSAGGQPVQVIRPRLAMPLPVVDLLALPLAVREAEMQRLAAAEARRGFDLAEGPLLRTTLLRLGEADHALLLNVHHIVSDGWSMGVLIRELAPLYAAFAAGGPSPLPELPVQYADFSHWQRQWLRGEATAGQLAYWQEKLAGPLPVLDLPTDRPRPAVQTFRGGSLPLQLSREVTEGLKALSRRQGATLFMTLLAAFKLLLARLSGQDDVVVGSPIAGRDRAETEGLIGFFLNTLVLRTDLAGNPTFLDLLGRVRDTALGAYANQSVPFEKLLEALQPERDLSRTPFFQVFFNMLNFPEKRLELPNLSFELVSDGELPAKFDLTFYLGENAGGLGINLVYNAGLFAPERMAEVLRQFEGLLGQAVADPERPLGGFSLVTPAAAALLPDPRAALSPAWEGAVHSLFARQARRVPDRVAVADPGESWTYAELEAQSNRLAHFLAAAGGVAKGDAVALYGHRSAALVWAVLGVLKAGAAFVILDPAYPAARQLQCLALVAPRALVRISAAGPLPEEVEQAVAEIPCRIGIGRRAEIEVSGVLAGQPDGDPGVEVGPDDIAYVSFTSGSTGVPKGVLGRHGPLTHFVPWMGEEFGLGEADRFTMLSGLAHDPLQRDMFTPLQLGATIVIPDPADIGMPGRIAGWMRREGVTIAHLTPAMGQLLTESVPGDPVVEVPSLRYAFLVGDVLTRLDVARLRRLAPGVTCVNFYGSTETQRAVGHHVVREDPAASDAREILPLGRGMRDVQLLVLARGGGGLAGVGELGEIAVRSPHLAAGYLGDGELTRERFVANPLGTGDPLDRLYRTGDLGRYRPDGEAEFVTRADNQVKIRGFRIELGEIEAALARHPAVREAVVIARPGISGEKRLVAYVVLHGERLSPASDLQDFLRERLPEYMVPPAWVELAKLPLTPNGKLDRRALPEPDSARADLAASYVAPRTEVEQAIAEIWREVLQLDKVGIHEKFFHLGGHSLLLVRVHARLRERFGQELSMMDLFKYPDISSLAQHLTRNAGAPPPAATDTRAEELEEGKARRRQRLEKSRTGGGR
ncbi:MAG TPA: amino acid adenylation domain-containing protein, partial [Thermoanaerobaculia bacterium]|nr:amino acid adenylation domain-containing protein [Thermoanaerobaculia bacterium]